jgi:hypothetical protein
MPDSSTLARWLLTTVAARSPKRAETMRPLRPRTKRSPELRGPEFQF